MFTLRAAANTDIAAIADVWHRGWLDGHLGHVPEALLAHRQHESFLRRVPERVTGTTVATLDGRVVAFSTVCGDELEQFYVDRGARGGGVAVALIRQAEHSIALTFDRAWLAVVTGNARARRFYAREGWVDGGPFDYPAPVEGGTLRVPCHRYEKPLARAIR